ncbi:prolyl-tRNA synthetase [Colletotrichum sojae]|uniref:proline--tRNA ligase n=1 Tax=Colletotrichum sojae TaxID=2175907 RepID=A0A8H6JE97_9PEZI|nr:prolyl-tRNA synthetase [Colletotrichum sojae]
MAQCVIRQDSDFLETIARSHGTERTRSRLSTVWVPTGGIEAVQNEDAHNKLIRAGFIRQSHSGIFHLLPLGRRVQDKLEKLIDFYMQDLGASRVALSTITSKDLWQKSGRLALLEPELFGFDDRKGAKYMLSPTHEEEITSLVAKTVKSYKDLPLRLYQITRKFRDELRPRHGLLRSREFTMKDLYTFDVTHEGALETYQKVQAAYAGVFGALKLPVIVARASSGDMGGDLSHEYHLPTPVGEDTVITCNTCDYTVNTEIADSRTDMEDISAQVSPARSSTAAAASSAKVWRGISKDRSTLVNVWYPGRLVEGSELAEIQNADVSIPAVKTIVSDLDASVDDVLSLWKDAITPMSAGGQVASVLPKIVNLIDYRLSKDTGELLRREHVMWPQTLPLDAVRRMESVTVTQNGHGQLLNLLTARTGDRCPSCTGGFLKVQKALEVGHTFHLGTRYSKPLGAVISIPPSLASGSDASQTKSAGQISLMQMGCHGIGVSRLIGAVVEHLADEKGLQWPRAIAPYEAVVISGTDLIDEAIGIYDELTARSAGHEEIDAVLDDRNVSFGWKMKDADLIGYPVIVVVGRVWKETGNCEVQCRRLGVKDTVPLKDLQQHVSALLGKL